MLGPEPYPAVFFPGFPGNGSKPIIERALYLKDSGQYQYIHYSESSFGHSRYRKLLLHLVDAVERQDTRAIARLQTALIGVCGIAYGDTLLIAEVEWVSTPNGYTDTILGQKEFVVWK